MWQPIETAPRDGSSILTCKANGNYAASIRVCWYVVDQYEGRYWRDDGDSEPSPTHWMPIPQPPTKGE